MRTTLTEADAEVRVFLRFMQHVDTSAGWDRCWVWTGAKHRGYGQFALRWYKNDHGQWRTVTIRAHRYMYEWVHELGSIPEGFTIEHRCRKRSCVNPLHLEVLTRGENARRGNTSDMCRAGLHEMTEDNVVRRPSRPATSRECRACKNAGQRRRAASKETK